MILPIGPIHPYLKEPIRLKLQTEGERVVKAEIEYGYVHRGIEKIIEGKTWQKGIYLAERVCGICSYEHKYHTALNHILEKLMQPVQHHTHYILRNSQYKHELSFSSQHP